MTAPVPRETRYKRRGRARADELAEVLNSEDAARLLGCGVNTVRQLVKDGQLPRLPFGGNAIRISKVAVMAYLAKQAQP